MPPTDTPTYTPVPPTNTPTFTTTPCSTNSHITANFNGTAISAGNTIWFNSVFKPNGIGSAFTQLWVSQQTVQFTDAKSKVTYSLTVPNALITFNDSNVSQPTTSFNKTLQRWETKLPSGPTSGNTYLAGVVFDVPSGGLVGGVKNITWSGAFSSSASGVSLQWKWAAAVYASFNDAYKQLGAKPVDVSTTQYPNSDHAGTPENYKGSVTGGATGGGGSNYTGSYSGTANVTPCVSPNISMNQRKEEESVAWMWKAVTWLVAQ